jgi:hypothetical protein
MQFNICQQVVSDSLQQLDEITALLQVVDKLATCPLPTHFVEKVVRFLREPF